MKVIVDSVLERDKRWEQIRRERDARLNESDALMLRANEIGVGGPAWQAYRQSLRDLPQTQPDPTRIVWPTPPS